MKKILLSIAALLPSFIALSQEADDLGQYAEVTIIPRLEATPAFGTGGSSFSLGNSSLYTLFEGSANVGRDVNLSWTVANHWLGFSGYSWQDMKDGETYYWPYTSLTWANTTNWLDYFLLDINWNNWTFSVGKDMIQTGGFEYDEWDWDVHTAFATPMWNTLSCYQWGAKVAYTLPSGDHTFSLQATSSPFAERPFVSEMDYDKGRRHASMAFTAQWRGEWDWGSFIWNAGTCRNVMGKYDLLLSLGQQFYIGDWTITADFHPNCGMFDPYYDESYLRLQKGQTTRTTVSWAPSEKFDVSAVCTEYSKWNGKEWNVIAGAYGHWYPLRDSQDLRLHLYAGWDCAMNACVVSLGARYNLNFNLWKR